MSWVVIDGCDFIRYFNLWARFHFQEISNFNPSENTEERLETKTGTIEKVDARASWAVSGAIACSYEDHKEKEPLAGAIGGLVGCPIALGIAIGFLDIVSNTYDFVLYLVCVMGLIPGFIVYLFAKELLCEDGVSLSSNNSWRNDSVQMV